MDLYRKGFVIAVVALCALALHWMLAPFWSAIAWAICLAYLLSPVHGWLTRKLRGQSTLSTGILTLLVPIVLAGPLISLGMTFANQFAELVARLQALQLRFDDSLFAQLESYPIIGSLSVWLRVNLTATSAQLQSWLESGAALLMTSLAASGGNILLGALGTLMNFFVMLFLLFYLLRDGHRLLARCWRLLPIAKQRRQVLVKLIGDTTRAVVYGEMLTALAQGALVGIGFAIAGLPSAIVFGVLSAFLALLPVLGAGLIWGPATLYLAATGAWGWALFMLLWGAGVSVSDNLLRPLLISHHTPVSTLAVFIGVIGGVSAFGAIGVILGPVLLTTMGALLRFVEESLVKQTQRTVPPT